ncbi:DNA sulfur modification protein DndD [Bacillus lacus]|uniref:Nuclease SbcCD subunit C n=1 Tax=Metabacillus lacus TaxID=1983721 RepID=A0A7X2LZL0_9BACI|nr:DNA sulfur modification protein DndD [Metabacillus lacus]MRX73058.1 DNA sulfur modification protein DndD [Metabacillus lacus]
MYIKKIQLTNIGPYRGMHSIDLSTTKENNTILIGGENGAGKTTFLNSIKMGLFGSFAYGYKTENKEYFKKVESLLNHAAKAVGENNFRLKLDFDITDELSKAEYSLYRSWRFLNGNIKEAFDVLKNGKHLNEYEKDLFNSRLREIMPPQLLDLCLFDGEEISRIINNNLLSSYIENLSHVLFNLDLFEALEIDLESYSHQNTQISSLNKQEKELFELKEKRKELNSHLNEIEERLHSIFQKQEELEEDFKNVKSDFEVYGGLVRDEREHLNQEINNIENMRKQNHETIRQFVANSLPFFIAKELVIDTRQQLVNEEKFQLYSSLNKQLTDQKISSILEKLQVDNQEIKSQLLKDEILLTVKPSDETGIIHRASFSESRQVENVYQEVKGQKLISYQQLIQENKDKLIEAQGLREKLKVNDSSSEFSEMLEDMERYTEEISQAFKKIETEKEMQDEVKNDLLKVNSSIETIEALFRDQEKSRNSFVESQKIISLSQKFREIQLKKKLQEVQMEALRMLNKLMRKRNYIASMKIDSSTFEVSLFDQNKEAIEKSTLSAGEKEILLLSIIWAIFKCSGRNVPFIFDTLLGRLDRTHKTSILTHFIPNSGKQVIILSTDSEIDEYNYELLHSYTAREFTLNFDVNKKETIVVPNYFTFKSLEV